MQFLEVLYKPNAQISAMESFEVRGFLRAQRIGLLHGANHSESHPTDFLVCVGKNMSSNVTEVENGRVRSGPSRWESLCVCSLSCVMQGWRGWPTLEVWDVF